MRPQAILFIGYMYFFYALLVLLSLFKFGFLNISFEPRLSIANGLPFVNDSVFKVVLGCLLLFISYGISKFKKWGYYLLTAYSVYLIIVSLFLYSNSQQVIFMGNVFFNAGIVYVLNRYRSSFSR